MNSHGVGTVPRLDQIDAAQPDVDARERHHRHHAVAERPVGHAPASASRGVGCRGRAHSDGGAEHGAGVEVDLAPHEPAGDTGARARLDHERRAARAALRGSSRAPRPARADRSPIRSRRVRPITCTPWIRRRRTRGSSSTNPITRSPGVSRSSRRRLRPLRPAPTMRSRRCVPRPTSADSPRATPRSRGGGADRARADQHVDDEDRRSGTRRTARVDQMNRNAAASDSRDGGEDGRSVARAGVPPDAAVDAERDEEDVARDEHRRQRRGGARGARSPCRALDRDQVRDEERRADQHEVDEHLDERASVDDQRTRQNDGAGPTRRRDASRRRGSCRTGRRNTNVISTPISVRACRRARCTRGSSADRGRDDAEQHDGALRLGEARSTRAGARCGRARPA